MIHTVPVTPLVTLYSDTEDSRILHFALPVYRTCGSFVNK